MACMIILKCLSHVWCLSIGVYSGEEKFSPNVRNEVHAEKPLHWKGCLKKCTKGNGNINYAWTSVPGKSMVLFSRYA